MRLSLSADAPLPQTRRLHLTAGRFFSHARTDTGWTDLAALAALPRLLEDLPRCRALFSQPLPIQV